MRDDSLIEKLREIFVDWKTFDLNLKMVADRISPVEKIVYGIATAFGMAAVGVLISLVFRK
jgi:hypothetical protein